MTVTPAAPHDELACRLGRDQHEPCPEAAVVSVAGRDGVAEWGCEAHAGEALARIHGAEITHVGDWAAAKRLLALRWNHRPFPAGGLEL